MGAREKNEEQRTKNDVQRLSFCVPLFVHRSSFFVLRRAGL
jgi:hypothetical protein